MRGLGLDRVLAGTAIALIQITVLATGNFGAARAESLAQDLKAIEALVPLPEPADVPPPTIADIAGLPMPEPAVVGTVAAPGSRATAAPEPAGAAPATVNAPAAPAATVSTPAAG
ncbi:MAG TPA: murein L,D-transpeptidase, partial [Xanthobacteraceae bacterium]|nr:murein L,D-transpeptidase [Xanthobacteraceae bacterium]